MPLIFIGSGLVIVIVGLKGNVSQLYSLIASDFSGPQSFIYWAIAILILGALGYIKGLENLSKLFLILVLVVLLLHPNPNTNQATGVTLTQMFQVFIGTITGQGQKAGA